MTAFADRLAASDPVIEVAPAREGVVTRFATVKAEPTGYSTGGMFVTREGAERLGLSVVELSEIERGRRRFVDEGDYERAMEVFAEARRRPFPPGCQCFVEVGDSPCPVHGEDEE